MSSSKRANNGKQAKRTKEYLAGTSQTKRETPVENVSAAIEGKKFRKEADSDYPEPPVLKESEPFLWNGDAPLAENFVQLGQRLALVGDLYRNPQHGEGLLLASPCSLIRPKPIVSAGDLSPVIADRVNLVVMKKGNITGGMPPSAALNTMLRAETFLQQFRPIDVVTTVPLYLPNFELTRPGFNDGGRDNRVFFAGRPSVLETSCEAMTRFLDVMPFASDADRTNTVAGALTVLLRNHWPGAKPMIAVTSTKSHGGKDTCVQFAAGRTPKVSLSYEQQDWALQKNFADAISHNPDVGLVNFENVRLCAKDDILASCYLERFLTDPEPIISSTGTGDPKRRRNNFVLATSTNFGKISEDLLNRSLPIHLEPVGDVASRVSPIGNPKLEYLPENRARIEAELMGMIEAWKDADRPLDEPGKHPNTDWSRTVGGILIVAGFPDFLQNYGARKTLDDPIRLAIGLLGAEVADTWCRPQDWVLTAQQLGLEKRLIPNADRGWLPSLTRALGILFTAHVQETFSVETEDELVVLRLTKARRRFEAGKPETRYMFVTLDRRPLPEDDVNLS